MHYFIEHHHLPEQNSADTFGPEHSSPQDIFKITSEFQLTQEAKAFACQAGIAFVQLSTLDPSLVNLILKPMYGLRVPQDSIQYYVYRGLLQSSFLSGTDLVALGSTNSELMAQVWADWEQYKINRNLPNLPPPSPADIGFEDTLADTLLIEALYNYSQEDIRGVFVKEGTWLGNFGSSQKIGFEIITQTENLTLNLGYLRSGKHQIDITGLSGLALRKKREEVLSFRDPAALFGMHYEVGVQSSSYNTSGNKTTQTYKEQALYDLLLKDKFATRNRVYLDIRSKWGLSYNFYQNYGDTTGNNIKIGNSNTTTTEQVYASNDWPLIMLESSMNTALAHNDIKINLRIDDNIDPILYLENTDLLGTGNRERFIADLIETVEILASGSGETATDGDSNQISDWTKEFTLQFPNVGTGTSKPNMAYYLKLNYFRQRFNLNSPITVPNNEHYFNNAFCPINLPNLGNVNDTFQRLQNPTKHFLKGQIAGTDFAYVAENGAYWDNDRILFYAQASHSYQSTGKFYSSIGIEHKLSLESQSFQSSFLNKNLNISCQLYEEEVSTGQYEPFKAIALGHYTGVPNFQENLLLLGITLSELEDLRLAADAVLSAEHPQYLFLEEETDSPKLDKQGRTFRKFILNIQGMKANGEQAIVTSNTVVYSRDVFCFTSKQFAEAETVINSIVEAPNWDPGWVLDAVNPYTSVPGIRFKSTNSDFITAMGFTALYLFIEQPLWENIPRVLIAARGKSHFFDWQEYKSFFRELIQRKSSLLSVSFTLSEKEDINASGNGVIRTHKMEVNLNDTILKFRAEVYIVKAGDGLIQITEESQSNRSIEERSIREMLTLNESEYFWKDILELTRAGVINHQALERFTEDELKDDGITQIRTFWNVEAGDAYLTDGGVSLKIALPKIDVEEEATKENLIEKLKKYRSADWIENYLRNNRHVSVDELERLVSIFASGKVKQWEGEEDRISYELARNPIMEEEGMRLLEGEVALKGTVYMDTGVSHRALIYPKIIQVSKLLIKQAYPGSKIYYQYQREKSDGQLEDILEKDRAYFIPYTYYRLQNNPRKDIVIESDKKYINKK